MSRSIVAKFGAESVSTSGECEAISLRAAYGPGNESWSKWTPAGHIQISITNPEAQKFFVQGKSYLVHFTEAPEEVPAEAQASGEGGGG